MPSGRKWKPTPKAAAIGGAKKGHQEPTNDRQEPNATADRQLVDDLVPVVTKNVIETLIVMQVIKPQGEPSIVSSQDNMPAPQLPVL